MHLRYKPPSYLRILFWSGERYRQISILKSIRSLDDPGGVYFKKKSSRQADDLRFTCNRLVMIENKRVF